MNDNNENEDIDPADLLYQLLNEDWQSEEARVRSSYINLFEIMILEKINHTLNDCSKRFYANEDSQRNAQRIQILSKETFENRSSIKRNEDQQFNINTIQDYDYWFNSVFKQWEFDRAKIEESNSFEREKITGLISLHVTSDLLKKAKNVEWKTIKTNFNLEKTAASFLSYRTENDIFFEQRIELQETDYLEACKLGLIEADTKMKAQISLLVYSNFSTKIKEVQKREERRYFKTSEWYNYKQNHKIIDLYGEIYVSTILEIFKTNNLPEPIYYWLEYDIYKILFSSEYGNINEYSQIQSPPILILKLIAASYFSDRSLDEIKRDERLSVTEQDYFEWCRLVLSDIYVQKERIEENRQDQINQWYYDNFPDKPSSDRYSEYGGPPDGYGGYLTDDFIDDALGGEPDANSNIS